jgi:hypothetical protein
MLQKISNFSTTYYFISPNIIRQLPFFFNFIKLMLSNARIEAVNNKIKVTIRMGYGFRNIDNLIALVKLKSGDYNIVLPGR